MNASTVFQPQVVGTIGSSGYTTTLIAGGRHMVIADEPVSAGGADEGADPFELLLMALASCKLITLRMYADRKGWPMQGAELRLAQRRIPVSGESAGEMKGEFIHKIDAELSLTGDLSPDQRERLREIADRCPVHRTLTSEIRIRTELAS